MTTQKSTLQQRSQDHTKRRTALNADGIRFLVDFLSAGAVALEAPLQQAEQAGVPVAQDEEQKEWDSEVVLRRDRVPDGEGKVAANGKLDPRDDAEPLAVDLGLRLLT